MRLIENLEAKLDDLTHKYGLVALKGGTEVEDMTYDELLFLKQIAINLPVIVKIGGPEARNDIRYCKSIAIDGILAPMIESEYALENFITAVLDIYKEATLPYLAINVETITAYHNLSAIYTNPYFSYINQITVGRSDLSQSMKKRVDDDDVLYAKAHIYVKMKEYDKAITCYEKIFTDYKEEIRADNAMYELAQLYDHILDNKEKAKNLYERLFNEYSDSVFSYDARQRFRTLRGDVNQ